MTHVRRSGKTLGLLIGVSLFALLPLTAGAFWTGFPFGSAGTPTVDQSKFPGRLCPSTITAAGMSVPVFLPCKKDTPPPVDVCPNVPGTQTSTPCADDICEDEGGTWDGDSCEFPQEPEDPTLTFSAALSTINEGSTTTLMWDSSNADSCTASNGWSGGKSLDGTEVVGPTATTTYTLTCEGDGGSVAASVTINVIPEQEPEPEPEGKLLITEVIYDLATGQGSEPANEWVEIYNGTDSSVNLADFSIADASTTDALPNVNVPAGSYAVIVASSTTASLWSIPGSAVLVQLANTTIGNGLGNTGDMVALVSNAASTTVDAISWGSNTTAFSPSVALVGAGHSIARTDKEVDTNSAADWEDREAPTPGQ
jgi:hypothetical protein